jgi:hypothetical protein
MVTSLIKDNLAVTESRFAAELHGTSSSDSQYHCAGLKDSGDRLAFTQTQGFNAVIGNGGGNLFAAL